MPVKSDLRRKFFYIKRKLADVISHDSYSICNAAATSIEFTKVQHIGLYFPLKYEVNPLPLAQYTIELGKTYYLPRIAHNKLQWRTPKRLIKNSLGIPEPYGTSIPLWLMDIIFVPLVAFDRDCNRLGMGGGYYDRALADRGNALAIGLAYSCQEASAIPCDSWDIQLDAIITEQEIILA